jgi:predicted transposase/invertase (TIGR01784 family)
MASEVLLSISKDEIERARLLSEYKFEVDLQSDRVYARREGLKEGKKEVARKLKARGTPLDHIAEDTGLTEAEIREL